jgi:hypothetical protein
MFRPSFFATYCKNYGASHNNQEIQPKRITISKDKLRAGYDRCHECTLSKIISGKLRFLIFKSEK